MKCEWVRENIVLQVYGELADDARHELEQHVARCADCAAELKAEQEFHALLAQDRAADPSPNLVAASRMRLQEALETAKQGSLWSRLAFDPAIWLRQVRFSPALASAILILGFAGGVGATYKFSVRDSQYSCGPESPNPDRLPAEASITGISSIVQEPGTNQINIKYNTVSDPGSAWIAERREDPAVAALSRPATTTTPACAWTRSNCWRRRRGDMQVREALMYALQNDTNPGVRLKSLDALGNYVKNDTNVRDAVLRALVNDGNSGRPHRSAADD